MKIFREKVTGTHGDGPEPLKAQPCEIVRWAYWTQFHGRSGADWMPRGIHSAVYIARNVISRVRPRIIACNAPDQARRMSPIPYCTQLSVGRAGSAPEWHDQALESRNPGPGSPAKRAFSQRWVSTPRWRHVSPGAMARRPFLLVALCDDLPRRRLLDYGKSLSFMRR